MGMMLSMDPISAFIAGMLVGGVIVWLFVDIRTTWQRGRGLLKAPVKARADSSKAYQKAREDVSKGWRDIGRAVIALLLLALMVAALLYGAVWFYSV